MSKAEVERDWSGLNLSLHGRVSYLKAVCLELIPLLLKSGGLGTDGGVASGILLGTTWLDL